MSIKKIILFHKPYGVLSQFTDADGRKTLIDFIKYKNVYAAGRLDRDSEGLLLLTNDGALQHQLTHPDRKMSKTYWVQVEGVPGLRAINQLIKGVELNDGMTLPAQCRTIQQPPLLESRVPPIRVRKTVADSWLEIIIKQGRNRQVRRMCAAVGYPVLRLIRYQIGHWTLDGIAQGEYRILK